MHALFHINTSKGVLHARGPTARRFRRPWLPTWCCAGLTSIGFWEYVGASWAGMLPGTFAYVYLGGAGKAAVDAAGGSSELDPVKTSLYGREHTFTRGVFHVCVR
jgi:hypothetical protein